MARIEKSFGTLKEARTAVKQLEALGFTCEAMATGFWDCLADDAGASFGGGEPIELRKRGGALWICYDLGSEGRVFSVTPGEDFGTGGGRIVIKAESTEWTRS